LVVEGGLKGAATNISVGAEETIEAALLQRRHSTM
jgi:hypothetical protein